MICHPREGVPGYDCRSDGGLGGCGKTSIIAEPTEELVRDMVLTALDGPDLTAAITRREHGDISADNLADKIREDNARLQQVAEAFADGEMSREQLRAANSRLTERIKTNTDRLAALNGHRDLACYLGRGQELASSWAAMTLDQRRAVIRSVVEAVEIGPADRSRRAFDPDRIQIRWRV